MDGRRFTVEEMDGNRIAKVRVEAATQQELALHNDKQDSQ